MSAGPCTTCGGPHYARGLCRKHYNAAVRSGEIVVGRPGRRVGSSSLTSTLQHDIALALIASNSMSAVAKYAGVSRDQVRTIRNYLERLNA